MIHFKKYHDYFIYLISCFMPLSESDDLLVIFIYQQNFYVNDMPGNFLIIFRSLYICCFLFCGSCSEKVTLDSLLEEMVDRKNLSYFPGQEYKHQQFSSYNRASVSPENDRWFENFDMSHFIRVDSINGRREFVLLDAEGPGAIVRWWMTFYKAQHGILRIYFDQDTIPIIEGAPDELLSGTLLTSSPLAVSVQAGADLGEEGRDYDHNLYVPLPFAKNCKITYECDSMVLLHNLEGVMVEEGYYWPDVFYNIGCRFYTKNTNVESVTRKALIEARPLIEKAGKSLKDNTVNSEIEEDFDQLLLPGDSVVFEFRQDQKAINRLMIDLKASNMPQALRSTLLKVSFDGHQTIWIPLGEFFGTGYSLNPHKTWMNQRDENGRMESFWIMPFMEKCEIVIINYGKENIKVKGMAGLTPYKWTDKSMYFGASWHEYHHINSKDENGSPFDLNFISIKGKGVYVGDQLTLYNNTYHWWGEGDEKIFVDGESFPSSFGTGSEDYYGYSFARPESFSHPFLSQPEGKGNTDWGLTVNMRHRSLDAIPFNLSISSNIELWHWATVSMNFALTAYWYVHFPFEQNIEPDIQGIRHPVAESSKHFRE